VLNDMMCHSALVVRHLLTKPGEPYDTVKPVRITGHIASLKWSRPEYAKVLSKTMDKGLDYTKTPSEDFANVVIEFETSDGYKVLGEASTSGGLDAPARELPGRRPAPPGRVVRPRVLDELEHARLGPQAVLQPAGERKAGRGSRREA